MSAHPSKSIHQSIEAAMGCLDLTLESELTLFRNRHPLKEAGDNESSPELASNASNASTIHSTSVDDAELHDDETLLFVSPPTENESIPPVSDNLAEEAARLMDVSFEEFETEDLDLNPIESEGIEDLEELYTEENLSGAIVPSKALLPSEQSLSSSATLETYTDPALDDYLESSEVLLQHLDTPVAKRQLDDSISLKWFGWAAGVTLVLSLLAAFFLQNMFKTPDSNPPSKPPQANVSEETEVVQPDPPSTPDPSTTIDGPDLRDKEFQSVDPGKLGSLPTPEKPATNSSTPDSPKPSTNTPETSTTPPATNPPESTPSSTRQFYVVTNYTDESSLETVQKIVPDAQVVNFTAGTRIQLQQFSDETTARTAAENFKQQGLAVEILATASE